MNMLRWFFVFLFCFGVFASGTARADSGTVTTTEEISSIVTLRNVRVTPQSVSGVLVNHSPRALRDVRLMVRHAWLWRDERNPGHDNPGRTDTYVVPNEIPAGETYQLQFPVSPPLPERTDGHFVSTVEVVGLTQVGF